MNGLEVKMQDQNASGGGSNPVHRSVLSAQVLHYGVSPEAAERGGWFLDGTLGAGGHSSLLLGSYPRLRILGVDQDPEILEHARARLAPFGERARVVPGRISELPEICAREGIESAVGMLFDLGVSSLQLDEASRGFSFLQDGPLDMRMDPTRERTAADIVNSWDESDLADLLYYEGGETHSRRIARAIVQGRRRAPFLRTLALADWIEAEVGAGGKTHAATRCFQALRRAVNEEGEELDAALSAAEDMLVDRGRLVIISFHSGEDAQVKRRLRDGAREGLWSLLTRKPVRPEADELRANRRSRSASLRAAERVRLEEEAP